MTEHESDFGQGCCYNLGLFIAHQYNAVMMEQQYAAINKQAGLDMNWCEMWFNGAADHFYDLVIPNEYPEELKDRLRILQSMSIHWRMPLDGDKPTKDNVWWALGEAKELLRLIDEFHGIKTVKGQWE